MDCTTMGCAAGRRRSAPVVAHARSLALGGLLVLALLASCARAASRDNSEQLDGAAAARQPVAPGSLLRLRRHAGGQPSASPALKQLLEGDEQVLRRQLPDLIAQAHQDKTVERALLKMLINASLRSGLSNMVANSQQANAGNNWQLDNDNSLTQYSQMGDEFVPMRSARMDQASSGGELATGSGLDAADLASLTASIQQLQPLFEQQRVDKREYIKPCSFNAISCVRRPFGVNK